MVLYDLILKYDEIEEKIKGKEPMYQLDRSGERRPFRYVISEINEDYGIECACDGNVSLEIISGSEGILEYAIATDPLKVTEDELKNWIINTLVNKYAIDNVTIEKFEEITVKEFTNIIRRASRQSFNVREITFELGLDYFYNSEYKLKELYYASNESFTKEMAIAEAKQILADQTLYDEIDRIYDEKNKKEYFGNPVHYKISADNKDVAIDIIQVLTKALKANNRLLGGRCNYLYDIREDCYGNDDILHIFKNSSGNCIAIEMTGSDEDHGIFASSFYRVINYFSKNIIKYQLNTLCFFVEILKKPGFSKALVASVQENIHIIDINEGKGDKEQALDYFEILTSKTKLNSTREELENLLPKQLNYTASEVHESYNTWYGEGLKRTVYPVYFASKKLKVEKDSQLDEPYEKLKNMIGLTEVKSIVNQILNNARLQKMRSDMGMDSFKTSQHMIFTGNPGSAKTTVARLIAEILKKENVLESGNFVECGRADLIAKYVGWTAKAVRQKFREAKGGILFIDEAYSLVDDSNSFADEAINTIVQEMENHRDDVIVIFAGYPEKMEAFLDKNEGLRSRIAFHVNFPDYDADEMLEILLLMAKEKGFDMSVDSFEKCHTIFEDACSNKDFGNGRFARNLLKQAMLKQADRLMKENHNKKISRKKMCTLIADDFDVNVGQQVKKKNNVIGFNRDVL